MKRNKYQKIIRDGEELQSGSIDTHVKFEQLTDGVNFKNKKVIDLGCNLGEMCRLSLKNGAKSVIGIDRTREFIEQARELSPHIDFRIGNENIINGKHDIVIASAMFHYVLDQDNFFKRIAKCSKMLIMDVWLSEEEGNKFVLSHRNLYIPTKEAFEYIAGKYFGKVEYKSKSISPDKSKRFIYHLSEPKVSKPKALLIYGTANTGKTTMAKEYEVFGYKHISLDMVFMAWYNKYHKTINMPYSVSAFVDAIPKMLLKEYHLFHNRYVKRLLADKVGHDIVIEGYDMMNEDYKNIIKRLLVDWEIEEINLTKVWTK